MKRTELYETHLKHHATMTPYQGWEMPLHYTSILKEHTIVRQGVGVFDCSHMGEILIAGKESHAFVDFLISNTFSMLKAPKGSIGEKRERFKTVYSGLLYENGTFVDDVIAYKLKDKAVLVVNAGNIEKDFSWVTHQAKAYGSDVEVRDLSEAYSLLAVQGKESQAVIDKIFPGLFQTLAPFEGAVEPYGEEGKAFCMASKTGYTGEPGMEFIFPNGDVKAFFEKFVKAGAVPCGLGSRDTLRLEKGYSLYGHEIDDKTNVLEAGLKWTVDFSKEDFIGKKALLHLEREVLSRYLRGILVEERGIPRQGDALLDQDNRCIGRVTSGAYSPLLKKSIALGYIDTAYTDKILWIQSVKNSSENKRLKAHRHKRVFI